ncbi:hypothetical protein PIB30_026746 [Stylosanthes scabra]|uniref:TIR domain-containing protein n=1 Tax=Stylosanthes scabra TaxID=79078 RepID=A0ABU6VCS3_9FABA|nr:hypothetical protein [Stylosanthes scabra]
MDCIGIKNSLSHRKNWKYDVFVSFRGDTRFNFTDHLFAALHRHGILAFRDDTKLQKGGPISPGLLQAIEGSHVLIVVFSINYASSTWCLQELAKIAACIQETGQCVLPVFYDVSPSEVRKQSGNYEAAFKKHEERFKDDADMMEQLPRWREALTQVANLSGWDVRDKSQSAEIEKIVKVVTSTLSPKQSSSPSNDIVGMQSPLEDLEKFLVLDSEDDVRVVGICGMGGIGKSTLATTLYEKISHPYDISCFVDDGIQLEKLAIKREWVGRGSRIIIVSRDEHLLREYGADDVYKVKLLNDENSLQLFSRKAFKFNLVTKGYESLTKSALAYANGLPLAIKVLGSFLFGRDTSEWRSALVRLKEKPTKDIMDVLRISFDGLEDMEKEIFLDIACFFDNHVFRGHVKDILRIRGFHADIGIRILIDKSLLTYKAGTFFMHDLLRELGRSIVKEKSPKEPRKWSRLWNHKDLSNVLQENKTAENIEAIVVQQKLHGNRKELSAAEALSQLSCLKLLIISQPNKLVKLILSHSNIKKLWKGIKVLHNLTHLELCHSKNLVKIPNLSQAPNLERLDLKGCVKLIYLDASVGSLQKLRFLNLENCENLVSIPNSIFDLNSLRCFNLSGCWKLFKYQLLEKARQSEQLNTGQSVERHMTSSICKTLIRPLHFFSSRRHPNLIGLLVPCLSRFPALTALNISFCNLVEIPDAIRQLPCLEYLNIGGNNIVTLPDCIKELPKLRQLNLEYCKHLKWLPSTLLPMGGTSGRFKYGGTFRGLCVFNCPNLSDKEGCGVTVISWMIKMIQVSDSIPALFSLFDSVSVWCELMLLHIPNFYGAR